MTRVWRQRIIGALVTMFWAGAGASVLACPVCFRVEEGPVTDGVRAAVIVLVGVTVGVLSGFGVFIVRFVRRAAVEDLP